MELHSTKLRRQYSPNVQLLDGELFLGSCAFVEIGLATKIEGCTMRGRRVASLKAVALRYPGLEAGAVDVALSAFSWWILPEVAAPVNDAIGVP